MRHAQRRRGAVLPSPPAVDARARLGDLFRAEADSVFSFVYRRCGVRAVAEDVTAETFAEAARVVQTDRCDQVSPAWLMDVARKRLIDHWRRDGREARRQERLLGERVVGTVGPASDSIDGGDIDGAVGDALDSLPIRQRAVLMLRYVDECSVSEVATAMSMTYRATESLLARARRSLLDAYDVHVSALTLDSGFSDRWVPQEAAVHD